MSGILHVIKSACRWKVCPSDYGPSTTVYNRSNRRSRRSFWTRMLEALAKAGWPGEAAALVATYVKTQRAAHGGKKGGANRPSVPRGRVRPPRSTSSPRCDRPTGRHPPHPGNASDVKTAPAVLDKAPGRVRRLIADKGYDADWLRLDLREQGISVIIPAPAPASARSASTGGGIGITSALTPSKATQHASNSSMIS